MKKLLFILFVLMVSCTTYQTFVQVTPQGGIPDGCTEITCQATLDDFKSVLKTNSIMFKTADSGLETDEIIIDEGTRAKYKVYEFDGALKIVPYWGITQKVKSQMGVYAGAAAASAYDTEGWDRVIYNSGEKRPKRVYDYGWQLAKATGGQVNFK
jgi:hypothetical protein